MTSYKFEHELMKKMWITQRDGIWFQYQLSKVGIHITKNETPIRHYDYAVKISLKTRQDEVLWKFFTFQNRFKILAESFQMLVGPKKRFLCLLKTYDLDMFDFPDTIANMGFQKYQLLPCHKTIIPSTIIVE